MHIGYVGVGNMGHRFATKLLEAGHELTVFDVRQAAAADLLEKGAHWAESPADAAVAAGTVFASLPNPGIVERVVFDEETGVLAGMARGGTFVDQSTTPPMLARTIFAGCAEKGVHALDAPVSNGGVFTTAGGEKEIFEQFRPAFEAISEHVFYMGGAGQGQVAKLARQYLSYTAFFAGAEALLMLAKSGGDLSTATEFISQSTGQGPFFTRSFDRVFNGDFGDPETSSARLDIVAKDLHLAVELARQVASPAATGEHVDDILKRGQAQGWGQNEYWSAVQILEQMAGQQLRVPEG